MAQHGFRNFGSLTFLQGIDKPKFLTPLLKRHVRYFKRHGVDVAALDNDDATDRKLLEVFTQPKEDTPTDLREALHMLDNVSDEVGRDRIQAELDRTRRRVSGLNDATPGEFAIAVYLRSPEVIQNCYDQTISEQVKQYDEYQSLSNRRLTLALARRKRGELERALSKWFMGRGRGGLCEIYVYSEEAEIVFVITHGRNYRSVGAVEKDRRRSRVTYRPQKHDTVVFNTQTRILKLHAQFSNEKDSYRRCFGEVLFGNPVNFPDSDIYFLKPIQKRNFKLKITPGIESARMSEVWTVVHDEQHLLMRCSAYDVLTSARRRGHPNLQEGDVIRGAFMIKYSSGGRERKVELRPSNVAVYDRDRDTAATERFIQENGFLRVKRADGK
ncbi:MAG: hypothetical protein CHACPFDD_00389 [Phycisphaerae bacterium]|nr:hypothetical protein [Phycisphaerae bacterium]